MPTLQEIKARVEAAEATGQSLPVAEWEPIVRDKTTQTDGLDYVISKLPGEVMNYYDAYFALAGNDKASERALHELIMRCENTLRENILDYGLFVGFLKRIAKNPNTGATNLLRMIEKMQNFVKQENGPRRAQESLDDILQRVAVHPKADRDVLIKARQYASGSTIALLDNAIETIETLQDVPAAPLRLHVQQAVQNEKEDEEEKAEQEREAAKQREAQKKVADQMHEMTGLRNPDADSKIVKNRDTRSEDLLTIAKRTTSREDFQHIVCNENANEAVLKAVPLNVFLVIVRDAEINPDRLAHLAQLANNPAVLREIVQRGRREMLKHVEPRSVNDTVFVAIVRNQYCPQDLLKYILLDCNPGLSVLTALQEHIKDRGAIGYIQNKLEILRAPQQQSDRTRPSVQDREVAKTEAKELAAEQYAAEREARIDAARVAAQTVQNVPVRHAFVAHLQVEQDPEDKEPTEEEQLAEERRIAAAVADRWEKMVMSGPAADKQIVKSKHTRTKELLTIAKRATSKEDIQNIMCHTNANEAVLNAVIQCAPQVFWDVLQDLVHGRILEVSVKNPDNVEFLMNKFRSLTPQQGDNTRLRQWCS